MRQEVRFRETYNTRCQAKSIIEAYQLSNFKTSTNQLK
ncbi:hypothetical protein SynPROS91_02100 [Synechococcus sp. PROS-9-1]|nr:hypothetical protein SynPROS91_02100 [Synechococcus sp. PROS-9-1]